MSKTGSTLAALVLLAGAVATALPIVAAGNARAEEEKTFYISLDPQGPSYGAIYGPSFPVSAYRVDVELKVVCEKNGGYAAWIDKTFHANGDSVPVGLGSNLTCPGDLEGLRATATFSFDGKNAPAGKLECTPVIVPVAELGKGQTGEPNKAFVKSIRFSGSGSDTQIADCTTGFTPAAQ